MVGTSFMMIGSSLAGIGIISLTFGESGYLPESVHKIVSASLILIGGAGVLFGLFTA